MSQSSNILPYRERLLIAPPGLCLVLLQAIQIREIFQGACQAPTPNLSPFGAQTKDEVSAQPSCPSGARSPLLVAPHQIR